MQGREPRNYVEYREYLEDQLRQLDAQNEEDVQGSLAVSRGRKCKKGLGSEVSRLASRPD